MKPDNIYRTLVGIAPDLDSKQAWKIHQYVHELIDDECQPLMNDKPTVEQIFIVSGTTGEYSDRVSWNVKAFVCADKAEQFAEACNAEVERIEKAAANNIEIEDRLENCDIWSEIRWNSEDKPEYKHAIDPNFTYDYTGTSYRVSFGIELDTTGVRFGS